MMESVRLTSLGGATIQPQGLVFGVPWSRGSLAETCPMQLRTEAGEALPVQTTVAARWPDGSVKWTSHAASLQRKAEGIFELREVREGNGTMTQNELDWAREAHALSVRETPEAFHIETGPMSCRVPKRGDRILGDLTCAGRVVSTECRLVAIHEARWEERSRRRTEERPFLGVVESACMEQSGPVMCVIRLEGRHVPEDLNAGKAAVGVPSAWLPFTVRLSFFAGQDTVRMVHTFLYDGDKEQDFVKGLGVSFRVPLAGAPCNRHVRLAGDTGFFAEPTQLLNTWRPRIDPELYARQLSGEPVDPLAEGISQDFLNEITLWNDYRLVQDAATHHRIEKRTQEGCCWVSALHGRRSDGVAYAGGTAGGLAAGLRNFWQKHPTEMEIRGMSQDVAELIQWMWSPAVEAMDLRHYDTVPHMNSYYEGFEEIRSTPFGIANTSELLFGGFGSTPTHGALEDFRDRASDPALLICEPARYRDTKAIGIFSLPDLSHPGKAAVEHQLDAIIDYYHHEREQRDWYGFWNYGDFMHSYDAARHCWKYDMGGYAWQNTELVPTYWLWYAFLRSGRKDIYRLAEAMSRHAMDVDVYHAGAYKGLGSRHNVLHWGCSCKEARISMAGHHRFAFYLTGDGRTGDVLDEVRDADHALLELDPMRAYYPSEGSPTHARSGPDWSAFCSNWMTAWERHGDMECRDRIMTGIRCLQSFPLRLIGGSIFGYDPQTGMLAHPGEERDTGSHLLICMGAAQVWLELVEWLEEPEFEQMLVEYGGFYTLPAEEKSRRTNGAVPGTGFAFPIFAAAMMSHAASRTGDAALGREVWQVLAGAGSQHHSMYRAEPVTLPENAFAKPISEISWASTNTFSQWALNTIVSLELAGEHVPEDLGERMEAGGL